jgi:hypothetical protein
MPRAWWGERRPVRARICRQYRHCSAGHCRIPCIRRLASDDSDGQLILAMRHAFQLALNELVLKRSNSYGCTRGCFGNDSRGSTMPMPLLALEAFAHANEGIPLSSVPKSAIGAYMRFPKTGLSLGIPRVLPCTIVASTDVPQDARCYQAALVVLIPGLQ